MRTIKFRAWDTDEKFMYNNWTVIDRVPMDYVLMQFTGLKDKNGKEIYEGDVLDYKYNGTTKEVFWESAMFRFRDKNGWGALSLVASESEVIGNIWENSELLKD